MKLAILDRDGTLNPLGDDFITSPEEWSALPGALEADCPAQPCRLACGGCHQPAGAGAGPVRRGVAQRHPRQDAAAGGGGGRAHRRRVLLPARARRGLPLPQAAPGPAGADLRALWRGAFRCAWWWAVARASAGGRGAGLRRCTWCARAARPICTRVALARWSFLPPRGCMPAWQHLSSICCPRRLQRLCRSQRLRSLPLGQTHPQGWPLFSDAIYLIAACACHYW
jgi:hypothetical protein